jgi:hypothetical protein
VDLVLGATENFKILDYINDLSKKWYGRGPFCESQADSMWEFDWWQNVLSWKYRMVVITNVPIVLFH